MQLTVPKWTGSGTGRTLGYLHTHTHTPPHAGTQGCNSQCPSGQGQVQAVHWATYTHTHTHTHHHMQARKDATHSAQVDRVRYRPYTGLPTHTHTPPHAGTQGCNSQCPSGQGQVQAVHHAHDEYVCDVPAVGCL